MEAFALADAYIIAEEIKRSNVDCGKITEISEEDFSFWREEAYALWGYLDFWGDFVPGLLQPELPVIECEGNIV